MKLRNKIFNYFVIPPVSKGEVPRVVQSPVTINYQVAKKKIEEQFKDEKKPPLPSGPILHVCFDYDSQMVYMPNASDFSPEKAEYLLGAAEVRITKDFGGFASRPPIKGSPFSSLRVRSINSFVHAKEIIGKHYEGKVFEDLPVIEAYLPRMPTTLKSLPNEYRDNEEFLGGYIGPNSSDSITFIDELDMDGKKRKEPIVLLSQKTPFILINIAKTQKRKEPTATEKEWVVLSGYRDYLYDEKTVQKEKYISEDINQFADLYSIKRYLYLGWSFEEVCVLMLSREIRINNPKDLYHAIERIMRASESLKQEGYPDPAAIPYYITFKIGEDFPINIAEITDLSTGDIKTEIQYQNLLVLDYDRESSYVLIETPVFISPAICEKILKAKSTPFISRYNPVVNRIDIKSVDRAYSELKMQRIQLAKIQGIVQSNLDEKNKKDLEYRSGPMASGEASVNPRIYNIRNISDYFYATDHIKKMCVENDIPFYDFNVVIGPIAELFGQGTMGGYVDKAHFNDKSGKPFKVPYEIVKGVWISPPVIFINSFDNPSYAEQTETLIHEYRHYIYGIQNPNYKKLYDTPKKKGGEDYEHWYWYFTDPNERAAHKDEIKFELGLGKSYDEIVRNKVGGQITIGNYPIAIKFSEMVQEALKELEEEGEKDEKPA